MPDLRSKRHPSNLIYDNSGATTPEYVMLLVFILTPILIILFLSGSRIINFIKENTPLFNGGLAFVLSGAVIAIFAWILRNIFSSMEKSAILIILENLSNSDKMKRRELRKSIQREYKEYYLFPSIINSALETLHSSKRVVIEGGYYKIPVDAEQNKEKS